MALSRTRDRDAEFRAFFAAEADRLRRFALFLTGDDDIAKDLAQEAMVRVYRSWSSIQNQDPGPYARRTVVNLVRSQHRRSLLRRRYEKPRREGGDPIARIEEWDRLAQALKTLPSIRRAVVVLKYYEDMKEADIARVLDRPLGSVKSDLHRALAKLRPLLEDSDRKPGGVA